jgi:hypothetical protein
MDPTVRKSVSDLSGPDLDQSPVWEFASDEEDVEGQDETTVRPVIGSPELDPSRGALIVRARFRLADGTGLTGCVTISAPDDGLESLQPVILSEDGNVMFWWGMFEPKPADVVELYRRLGKTSASQVFPLHFVTDAPIACGPVRGEVCGFMVLEDWRTHRIRIVT